MSVSLRVLTWNIHKGMNTGNTRFMLHAMRDALRQLDPDVLMLQEIHGDIETQHKDIHGREDNNQIEYIAESVWSHHVYGKNAVYQSGHHGNAVLSRFPLQEIANVDVSLMRRASRSLLHVSVDVPGLSVPFHAICVHLGLFGFERERQLRKLVAHIDTNIPAAEPFAVAGDFNDWRGRARIHFGELDGVEEVFRREGGRHARTFPSFMPLLTMDRVYVRDCEVSWCRQLRGRSWRVLSDHVPLEVELAC